jgi:diguanylate cyclase (GGDEF)-like protein
LGVCGVGEYLTEIQNLLITDEQAYDVRINLVDNDGVVQLTSNSLSIERSHIQNFVNKKETTRFVLTKEDGVYNITKYMPDLGLYLVVSRDAEDYNSVFSNLILYMVITLIIVVTILVFFIRIALKVEHDKVEDTAKKHGLASYAELYISTHLIDLKTNTIHEISNNSKYKLITTDGEANADKQLEKSIRDITSIESLKEMIQFISLDTLADRLKEKRVISHEFRSHDYGWCKAYFIVIEYDKMNAIRELIFALELIDEEKNRENELIYLSQTDLMTGLRNRGSGEKAMKDLINAGVEGMFCLLDADKFKSINDNYGHDVGDKVIKSIAECLKQTFRNTDVTMRLGGDEFAVYVVGVVNQTYGEVFIENFFDEIDAIEIPELGTRKITVSLGAAFFTVDENFSFAEIYKHADSAAYESKKFTGNHYTFYET